MQVLLGVASYVFVAGVGIVAIAGPKALTKKNILRTFRYVKTKKK